MSSDRLRIRRYKNHRDLLRLWKTMSSNTVSPVWGSGKAMEHLVLRAFELEKASVQYPFEVKKDGMVVEQIDGVVYTNGLNCLVECKDTKEPANIEVIAKLRNQLLRRPSQVVGIVFSRKGFTEPATLLAEYAMPQNVLLWSGYEIDFALKNRCFCKGLLAKYRNAVEYALPTYSIITPKLNAR
jgi:hypothetical protein